jgi:hypothetical protein
VIRGGLAVVDAQNALFKDSLRVLADIKTAGPFAPADAWCCFHFLANDDDKDHWGDEARAVKVSRPLFEALPFEMTVDYIGGSVGIEAWERVMPDEDWVKDRLPRMWGIADAARMKFAGWTFEPKEPHIFQATP